MFCNKLNRRIVKSNSEGAVGRFFNPWAIALYLSDGGGAERTPPSKRTG